MAADHRSSLEVGGNSQTPRGAGGWGEAGWDLRGSNWRSPPARGAVPQGDEGAGRVRWGVRGAGASAEASPRGAGWAGEAFRVGGARRVGLGAGRVRQGGELEGGQREGPRTPQGVQGGRTQTGWGAGEGVRTPLPRSAGGRAAGVGLGWHRLGCGERGRRVLGGVLGGIRSDRGVRGRCRGILGSYSRGGRLLGSGWGLLAVCTGRGGGVGCLAVHVLVAGGGIAHRRDNRRCGHCSLQDREREGGGGGGGRGRGSERER